MASLVDSSKTEPPQEPEKRARSEKGLLSGRSVAMSEESSPLEEKERSLKDKAGEKYNLLHELMKGVVGICVLLSILATLAMFADLYFNNSFFYFKQTLFGHIYQTGEGGQQTVSTGKSERSDIPLFEVFDDQPDPKPEEPTVPAADHEKGGSEKDRDDKALIESQRGPIDSHKESKSGNRGVDSSQPDSHSDSIPEVILPPPRTDGGKKSRVPLIAIIIDDIGFDPKMADAISRIDRNLTISILPGSPYGRKIARSLHSKGTHIILHLPMEPLQYPSVDPGYGAILSSMAPDKVLNMLNRNLDAIPYIEGVNNHMGSRVTALSPQMIQIFQVLKKEQLFFVDSLTSKRSRGRSSAKVVQLPFASRDIFLDNVKEMGHIRRALRELIQVAKRNGKAIAIGHPYSETYAVLKEEIATLKKSARIVPVSQLVAVP